MKISLVTRYSVRNSRFMGLAGLDSEHKRAAWLRYREVLFNKICLPSVLAQDRRPDVWMILLADGDEKIAAQVIPHDCSWILPVFVPAFLSVGESFVNFVNERLKFHFNEVTDELLVARLDSDDCIKPSYFSDLSAAAEVSEEDLFIFTRGVRWNGQENRIINYQSSPFLATRGVLRKNGESIVHSPFFNHSEAHSRPHKVVSPCAPAWLQVIHGGNISSSLDLKRKYVGTLDDATLRQLFGVAAHTISFRQD